MAKFQIQLNLDAIHDFVNTGMVGNHHDKANSHARSSKL